MERLINNNLATITTHGSRNLCPKVSLRVRMTSKTPRSPGLEKLLLDDASRIWNPQENLGVLERVLDRWPGQRTAESGYS